MMAAGFSPRSSICPTRRTVRRELGKTGSPAMISGLVTSLSLTGLLCLVPVASQADAESHRQEVETLFKLTHMEKSISEGVDNVLALQLRQNPGLQQYQDVVRNFLEKHIGWNSMKENIAEMYLKEFTEEELKQMNAFYITPTGQKVIERVPQLVQERNQLAMQRLQSHIGELEKEIAARQGQATQ